MKLDRKTNAMLKEVCDELEAQGELTLANVKTATILCRAYCDYLHALDQIDKEGPVITTHTGAKKINPWLTQQKQNYDIYARCSDALSLTPKAKGKSKPPTAADELTEFLAGSGE